MTIVIVIIVMVSLLLSYIVTISTPTPTFTPNTTPSTTTTTIGFNNYVIIRYGNGNGNDNGNDNVKRNEATDYAKSLLLQALLAREGMDDMIRQYIPVIFYGEEGEEIIINNSNKIEYHSLVEVKTFAIAIRLLVIPEHDIHITRLVVKSQQGYDLFVLPVDILVKAYQSLYLIWYIQLAVEGITDTGASNLLSALAYGYKQSTVKDIVLLSESTNIISRSEVLPLVTLAFNSSISINNNINSVTFEAILKNNTLEEYRANGIGIRDSKNNMILTQGIEEITVKPFDKVHVRMTINVL